MAFNANRLDPQKAAESAVVAIGSGYDLTTDIRLSACKKGPFGSGLIEVDRTRRKELVCPGGIVVSDVPASIKCDKGDRTRFHSDVVSFSQVRSIFLISLSFFVLYFKI